MFLLVIDFRDGQIVVRDFTDRAQMHRAYSIARFVFPSAEVMVFEILRVM